MNKKVHIALVGGQPAPVFYGILANRPDNVIFIYSTDSKDLIPVIKGMLDSQHLHCIFEDNGPLDPANPLEITNRAESLYNAHLSDSITLNITSGTKAWSHLFAIVFERHQDSKVIYIDQMNRLWDYSNNTCTSIKPISLISHLELYGNRLRQYIPFAEYTDEDGVSLKLIKAARKYNQRDFNDLTTILTKERNHKLQHMQSDCWESESGSYVEWDKTNCYVRLHLNNKGNSREFIIKSPHAVQMAFNSGWFEYQAARLLSGWNGAREILMNCTFYAKTGASKNEVDIIVRTDSRLLFAECKTKLAKPTDIDKFKTVVSNYGGSASLGIFITDEPMSKLGKEKCESLNLLTPFAFSEDYCLVSEEQALSRLLDSSIERLNI